jgi:hypothetical protein
MNTKELKKITKDTIELETTFSFLSFKSVDKKKGIVGSICKSSLGNIIELKSVITDKKIELQSSGEGIILISHFKSY